MSPPVNKSSKALDGVLARAERHIRRAERVQRVVQYSFLTAGLATVIGLYAASPSPAPQISFPDIKEIPIKIDPVQVNPIEVSPIKLNHPAIDSIEVKIVDIPPLGFGDLNVKPEIKMEFGDNYLQIKGAPPMSRDWHRTTFENVNDKFWALPELDFALTLAGSETGGPFQGCDKNNCSASFNFESSQFLNGATSINPAIILNDKTLSISDEMSKAASCKRLTFPYIPVLLCKLESINANNDACVWIRRSEHPENSSKQDVALDIKWQSIPNNGTCLQWDDKPQESAKRGGIIR